MRDARITVRLTGHELERLDGLARDRALSRVGVLRALLRDPEPVADATREEAVAMLAESARAGNVPARVALARLLAAPDARTPAQRRVDELAARRKAKASA